MKIDEFNNMNGDKLKADDTVHQLKIDFVLSLIIYHQKVGQVEPK